MSVLLIAASAWLFILLVVLTACAAAGRADAAGDRLYATLLGSQPAPTLVGGELTPTAFRAAPAAALAALERGQIPHGFASPEPVLIAFEPVV